jgi:hypothetical protein
MSTNENTATEKRDVYATVTDQIIKANPLDFARRARGSQGQCRETTQ